MKKIYSWILVLSLAFSVLFSNNSISTVNAATNLKTTYKKFVKHEFKKGTFLDDTVDCSMYDFNKDGVKELIVAQPGGARALYYVYTYKDGEVKYLTDGNEIGYIKGKKYLVSYGSGGNQNFGYNVYKISGAKLIKAYSYTCKNGKLFKKNKKKISSTDFWDFDKKVEKNLGKGFQVSKYDYYSAKQIGFSFDKVWVPKIVVIDNVSKSKITYYTEEWDPDTLRTISKSKKISAEITGNTKFYYGDQELYFSGKLKDISEDSKKWMKKISKAEFLEIMKTYKGRTNVINVKNGKATSIVINIDVVD